MENNAPGSNLVAVGYLRQPCVFIYQSTLCTLSCDDLFGVHSTPYRICCHQWVGCLCKVHAPGVKKTQT